MNYPRRPDDPFYVIPILQRCTQSFQQDSRYSFPPAIPVRVRVPHATTTAGREHAKIACGNVHGWKKIPYSPTLRPRGKGSKLQSVFFFLSVLIKPFLVFDERFRGGGLLTWRENQVRTSGNSYAMRLAAAAEQCLHGLVHRD